MIVVTAAGGQTGAAVVRALRARGEPVRAVVGRPRPRPELTGLGAEVVVAELTQPLPWADVLAGADALYLAWPNFDPDEAEGARALFGEARRAGVGRVVYHSVLRPQARSMPHHAGKDRAEEALDAAGLPSWRVLQPCAYAQNLDDQLPDVAATGRLRSPWGLRTAQSLVDLADVAEAAAVLLCEDGLDGGTFEAAGPEPLTAPRLAELLGTHLGRQVTAEDVVPRGEVPASYAGRCRRLMFDHYRAHGFVGSPRVLTALLGRPPRSFAEHLAAVPDPGGGAGPLA
ncbi:nucleoside-diphosphate sugar epimerase [Geodermatophilus sp. TF02-6]|uniref:SDR family oxidoreductase n=1 Tax=Geodermatophilus sp. TF02-6 TaxID=2250575 RepID=UPI000DEACA24|nr:NmrA family NAD(P)-binding protein [Geodermatophilus sp. TF02-6]RBY76429.1 nucleoside-diphosphate sugar epimerase [Geodermatophilus sp. TF02-6]